MNRSAENARHVLERLDANAAPATRRGYRADLRDFARFTDLPAIGAAVAKLIALSRGAARRTVNNYLADLRDRGAALNTARRRIATMRAVLRTAHELGLIDYAPFCIALPAARDRKHARPAPSRETVDKMLEVAEARDDAKGARDAAMIALMYYSALRPREVLALDVADVLDNGRQIRIAAHARQPAATIPTARPVVHRLRAWLEARGEEPGPLFLSAWPAGGKEPRPLTPGGLAHAIRRLGQRADATVTPQSLRQAAIEDILRLTAGNIDIALTLSRIRDPKALGRYARETHRRARQATEILAGGYPLRGRNPEFSHESR